VKYSPSGKPVVPSTGSLLSTFLIIGESPGFNEVKAGEPFVGKSGQLFNAALATTGYRRSEARITNAVPCRAPQDKFFKHSIEDVEWGRALLSKEIKSMPNLKVILTLGANPTEWVLGRKPPTNHKGEGFITDWRGSAISTIEATTVSQKPEDYLWRASLPCPFTAGRDITIVPSFHPAAVLRQFNTHPLFLNDIQRAVSIVKKGRPVKRYRRWYYNEPERLAALLTMPNDIEGMQTLGPSLVVAIDTEMNPPMIAIVTEEEVHVLLWQDNLTTKYVRPLLESSFVLKICHNWLHDYAWIRVHSGIEVHRPIYDTQGGASVLHSSLPKDLSPGVSTLYTNWAHHKWLGDSEQMLYCGMDCIVAFDAYWPQIEAMFKKKVFEVSEHDHKLLTPLMDMQARGFLVDKVARQEAEDDLAKDLSERADALETLVRPVIDSRLHKFEKPHLFRVKRKCRCCGGGKKQSQHCVACSPLVLPHQDFITRENAIEHGFKTKKALMESLKPCEVCSGLGKVDKDLPFNPDSPDQIADILYRGLGIRPRKFKGKETIKAAQLDGIKNEHPVIEAVVEWSKVNADLDTIKRLTPGEDGRLHCVFDPWGTGSGRVAGKESLVEPGTNPMNIPKKARRLVVPDPGFIFLYPDMAQIEARAVAVLSNDGNLLEAFLKPINWPGNPKHGKIDSHTRVMQLMDGAGVSIIRECAKRLTYAGMYGGAAPQIAKELNSELFRLGKSQRYSDNEVERMLQTFFSVFSGVRQWHRRLLDEVRQSRQLVNPLTGRVFEWMGFIIDRKTKDVTREVAKQIWSRLPQDIGAWVLAEGLIDLTYRTSYIPSLLQPLIHVHDALLIQCRIEEVEEAETAALASLSRKMWGMDFPSEMKRGMNWYEAS
jgi:uracil-DNA glycosylase family 4